MGEGTCELEKAIASPTRASLPVQTPALLLPSYTPTPKPYACPHLQSEHQEAVADSKRENLQVLAQC